MKQLDTILSINKLENLLRHGAIVFDVDDTLLARRIKPSETGQIFSDSTAAVAIPLLLKAGVRVCIITGHGWQQLEKRFVAPLSEEILRLFTEKADETLNRFFVYANRGATKLIWEKGVFIPDAKYNDEFSFTPNDLKYLIEILENLKKSFIKDFTNRKNWYLQNFVNFDFDELPPKILERERVVLGLRPIPSQAHSKNGVVESPRQKLLLLGCEALKDVGLDAKYELAASGKSTLEITKREVSKKIAFRDLIFHLAQKSGVSPEMVEESSIYVGDEFLPGGNDFVISRNFAKCLCFSVTSINNNNGSSNVISLPNFVHSEGVAATTVLIKHILGVLTSK